MPADNGFQRLLRQVRRCTICESLPLGPRPLLQCDATAKILIAAQAPGRLTHKSGIPFDDRSGDRLRDWLGVDRDEFYDASRIAILPMGFCYPGTGKRGDLPPRSECAVAWRDKLLAGLENIELTVLIGQYAQKWHLRERCSKTLTATVADWQTFWPQIIPTPHPSPRNALWMKKNPQFEAEVLPQLRLRVRQLLADE